MFYRRFLLLSLLIAAGLTGNSQDMLGTILGNYSGIYSTQVNPSAMTNSKVYLDVNIFGLDAFLQNNYLYIDKNDYKLSHFFQSSYQYPEHTELYGTKKRLFYDYSGTTPRQAYASVRIEGPGVMLAWGEHTFALTTAVRSVTSGFNIPNDIANFAYLGLNYKPQQNINYQDSKFFNTATITWAEIGLSYSYPVYARGLTMIALGASIRRLEGMAGGYMYSNDANYIVPNDTTLTVNNANGAFGYALPLNYDNNQFEMGKVFKGGGFAGDIGVTYTRLRNFFHRQDYSTLCGYTHRDYLYRIGLSLIDFGAIRFNTHAEKYSIDNRPSSWTNLNHFDFVSLHHFMDTVSFKSYGDPNASYRGDKVWIWLPAAISAQFDYHLIQEWYLNATVFYGLPMAKNMAIRPSEIAITPRYESGWFEANLPISLYNWYLVRVGMSLRFYYVTIGTDKIGWLFNANDFTGMDIYIAVKFNLEKGICGSKKQKSCTDSQNYQKKRSGR